MNINDPIRAVLFKEGGKGGKYVAQCLDVDIGVQGDDVATVRTRLAMTLRAEYLSRNGTDADPFPGIDPAPQYFHEMWDKCDFRSEATPISGVDHGASLKMALCA